MNFRLTVKSSNKKTGKIPVSVSSSATCPDSCVFKARRDLPPSESPCYAEHGPLGKHWRGVTKGKAYSNSRPPVKWAEFLATVRQIPAGFLWWHNAAGDLPGIGERISRAALRQLRAASQHARGFTYTHKPVDRAQSPTIAESTIERNRDAVKECNALPGLTINLSANSLSEADRLASLGIGPVVAVLPSSWEGRTRGETPEGRRVTVCPAQTTDGVTCATCGLCAVTTRRAIIGFLPHGAGAAGADAISSNGGK